jgi:hypothetical protein
MRLAGRIKRLEAQRAGTGSSLGSVALEHDAKGEPIGASVMRWDGEKVRLERRTGEAVENFLMRIRVAAGDLASVQAYVMDELRRVHGEA